MKWFDQNNDSVTRDGQKCSCGQNGLFLERRQVNRVVALLLLVGVFIFVGGYFWGQKSATDQLLNAVERDSFADQIYYSMCSMYDLKDDESSEPDAASGEEEPEQIGEQQANNSPSAVTGEVKSVVALPTSAPAKAEKKYFAQLVGFGSLAPAEHFVKRLKKKNINALISKRQSKTARGKAIAWYQVVTPNFSDKNSLNTVVATIKRVEKIHDVRIIEAGHN